MALWLLAPSMAWGNVTWDARLTGGVQWNPQDTGPSRFASGTGVRFLLGDEHCAFGLQVEHWWHWSLASSHQSGATERDYWLVVRARFPLAPVVLTLEAGIAVADYSATDNRPGDISRSGSTQSGLLAAGVMAGYPLGKGFTLEGGARILDAERGGSSEGPQFVPPRLAVRVDLGVSRGF